MYAYFIFNKKECKDILKIINEARNIYIKDLPPLFQGMIIEKIDEIIETLFTDEYGTGLGKIEYELDVDDIIIPAVISVRNKKEKLLNLNHELSDNDKKQLLDKYDNKIKYLLKKFVLDDDSNTTLYDVLQNMKTENERKNELMKSFNTEDEAIACGIYNPFEYKCYECGNYFWAKWRSKHNVAAICPFCGTAI